MTDIDLSQLSRSYPLYWISKNYGVDYSHVLELSKGYDDGYLFPPKVDLLDIYFVTYAVCNAPWRQKFAKELSPGVVERGLWGDGYTQDIVNANIAEENWNNLG